MTMKANFRRISGTGLVIGFAVWINAGNVMSQMIRIEARLDTNAIELGGRVAMNLTVEKPSGSRVEFPAFNDTLSGNIEILEKSRLDSSDTRRDRVILKQQLILTSFDTGLFYIPPLVFVYKADHFSDTIRTAANYLEVMSFPVDTSNTIRDIKGLYKAPVTFREIYPYLLIVLVMAIMGWLAVKYYRKRKRNEPIIARARPVDPPDVTALHELDRLKAEKLWQQGRTKEYYSRLADIIRAYIEGRYGIMALEQTSFEILLAVQDVLGKDNNYKMLKGLLQLSDLVKFAKADPEPDENVSHFDNAVQFVRETRLQQPETIGSPDHHPSLEKITDEI